MARQKKAKDNGSSLGFEEKLWLADDKFRGQPSHEVFAPFNTIDRPLLERATANSRESVQLAAFRDASLPKLLSEEMAV